MKVLPVFIFGYTCQQNIFSVNNEMERPTRRRVDTVIVLSVGIALVTYLIVAIAGFSTYGSKVRFVAHGVIGAHGLAC
jgi:amino acid permease